MSYAISLSTAPHSKPSAVLVGEVAVGYEGQERLPEEGRPDGQGLGCTEKNSQGHSQ